MLEHKVKAWLEDQGYPLELRVAAEFQRQKIPATLANYYFDPNTNQSRRIDVIAGRTDFTGYFQAHFVIECKKSSKHPWVLLTSRNSRDGFSPLFGYGLTNQSARSALVDGTSIEGNRDGFLKLPWMKYTKDQGVGLIKALSNSDQDIAFKAAAGAMAASIALRKELSADKSAMAFIFPTIVFDNNLFKGFLNEHGTIEIEEIQEGKLHFPMHFGEDVGTCVYISTASNLATFVADGLNALDELQKVVEPEAKKRLKNLASNKPITGLTW